MIGFTRSSAAAQAENIKALEDAGCDPILVEDLPGGQKTLSVILQLLRSGDTLVVTGFRQIADDFRGLTAVAERILAKGADLLFLNSTYTGEDVIRAARLMRDFGLDASAVEPTEEAAPGLEVPAADRSSCFDVGPERRRRRAPVAEILRLRGAGQSYAKIAEALNVPPSTVYSAYQRSAKGV